MNKHLLIIVILLIPLSINSFSKKETIFYEETQEIYVPVLINNEINNIELEEYIIGVIAGEMPASFEKEALKAQAIAARTYVINHLENNSSISPTTDNQVYITKEEMFNKWQDNYDNYYNKIRLSVVNTKGLIMLYNNKPIKAYYYSMSNGYTESSLNVFNEQIDYLTVIPSPFDEDNEKTIYLSKKEFCTNLNIDCSNIKINNINKDESNRTSTIEINNKLFSGIEIRKLLSLRSTDFTINIKGDNIEITTKGYGHGVGMSQYGANNMAKQGYSYEEILKYYYRNIEISSI